MDGYINFTMPNLHLHLAAGAVKRGLDEGGIRCVIGSDDTAIGMEVVAP